MCASFPDLRLSQLLDIMKSIGKLLIYFIWNGFPIFILIYTKFCRILLVSPAIALLLRYITEVCTTIALVRMALIGLEKTFCVSPVTQSLCPAMLLISSLW